MDVITLKNNFKDDVQALRSLDLPILDPKVMYGELVKLFARVFSSFMLTALISVVFVLINNNYLFGPNKDFGVYTLQFFWYDMGFSGLIALVICLLLAPTMNKYVLFKHVLKLEMKSGKYLDQKIKYFAKLSWLIYTVPAVVISMYAGLAFTQLFLMALACIFLVPFVLQFEVQRLGLSVFFDLISEIMAKR